MHFMAKVEILRHGLLICWSLIVSFWCIFEFFQVKTGMTMTEKILARASEKTQLSPGENVWVNVDILMTHDVCGPGAFAIFKKEFGENAKVFCKEQIWLIDLY